MFQKIFAAAPSGRKPSPRTAYGDATSDKLEQQRQYGIDQRRRKHPLRRLIPMRIDVNGKKHNIQYQTRHRYRRDLRLIRPYKIQKIPYRIQRIEFYKIIDDEANNRRNQAKHHAQPEVVFFEYHDFHVFSSLLFRT